jgi:hypothetical protein
MEITIKEGIVIDHEIDTKSEIVSTFAEIIKDTEKDPLKYIKNWKAPGGGE